MNFTKDDRVETIREGREDFFGRSDREIVFGGIVGPLDLHRFPGMLFCGHGKGGKSHDLLIC